MLDGGLLIVGGALALLAGIALWSGGTTLLADGLGRGVGLLRQFALLLVLSFLAAGIAEVLVPLEWVRRQLGPEAGVSSLALAALAGALTPAGPFTAMPIAAIFVRAGASTAAVLAYVTGWSLLAVHRLVAWEVPILGARFAATRFALSLVVPLAIGLIARLWMRS